MFSFSIFCGASAKVETREVWGLANYSAVEMWGHEFDSLCPSYMLNKILQLCLAALLPVIPNTVYSFGYTTARYMWALHLMRATSLCSCFPPPPCSSPKQKAMQKLWPGAWHPGKYMCKYHSQDVISGKHHTQMCEYQSSVMNNPWSSQKTQEKKGENIKKAQRPLVIIYSAHWITIRPSSNKIIVPLPKKCE